MSFIDWNAAALPSAIQGQDTQNQQNAFALMQAQRARSALQGVDLSDPGSVNGALTGLLKAGALDQAKSLTDLAMTRGVNSASLPVIQSALGLARDQIQQSSPTSEPPQGAPQPPDLDTAHRQILQQSADAVNDLLGYADPVLRAAKADIYRQQFAQMGVPKENIDEVLGDLSDRGLKQHAAYLTAVAQGDDSVEHPTGHAATQSIFNANNPGSEQAIKSLSGYMGNPIVQAALAKAGIDISPGMNQAIAITQPARSAAASAPYTPVTVEGSQGQNVSMSAANFATGQASPGAAPIVGATPGAKTAQGAAANAPYTPVTVTGPQGQPITQSAAQFAAGRGAPQTVGTPTGPANAPPIEGPTTAAAAGLTGGANANVQAAQAFETRAGDVPTRKANLANLRQLADEFSAGPQSGFWKSVGAVAAEYGIPVPNANLATNATAAQEEFDKLSTSVLAAQRQAMGLPVTDQSVAITTGATPNERMTPKGIARVLGVMEGNEDYINAERQAWQSWKDQGHGYETWGQFQPQFNRMFDPRIFQAQYMAPDEAAKVKASIPNYDVQVKVAKRLGYIAQ